VSMIRAGFDDDVLVPGWWHAGLLAVRTWNCRAWRGGWRERRWLRAAGLHAGLLVTPRTFPRSTCSSTAGPPGPLPSSSPVATCTRAVPQAARPDPDPTGIDWVAEVGGGLGEIHLLDREPGGDPLVEGGQTRLLLDSTTPPPSGTFCASGGCHRVRCAHDLVLSHKTLEPAEVPVRQPALS
jgi:hypothetical protein